MKKYIVLMLLVGVLSLWGFDEDFPFGMNSSIRRWWGNPIPEAYREEYKSYLDSGAVLGTGWWRAQMRFRWGDIESDPGTFIFTDEDSLVKWTGERGIKGLVGWSVGELVSESGFRIWDLGIS